MTAANPVDDALNRAFKELRAAVTATSEERKQSETATPLLASVETVGRLAFTPEEAAKVLSLSGPWTVRRLIQARKLRARNTGARYIIPGTALIEYLDGSDDPMGAGGDAA